MLGISRGLLRGARRGVLTTKKGPIGYYKGRGAAPTGYHSRKGRYIIVPSKIPEIVVPDLSTTELRPYVGRGGEYVKVAPPTAEDYMPLIRQQGVDLKHVRSMVRHAISALPKSTTEKLFAAESKINQRLARTKRIEAEKLEAKLRKLPPLYFEVKSDDTLRRYGINLTIAQAATEELEIDETDTDYLYDSRRRRLKGKALDDAIAQHEKRKVAAVVEISEEETKAAELRAALDAKLTVSDTDDATADAGDATKTEGETGRTRTVDEDAVLKAAASSLAEWLEAEGAAQKSRQAKPKGLTLRAIAAIEERRKADASAAAATEASGKSLDETARAKEEGKGASPTSTAEKK